MRLVKSHAEMMALAYVEAKKSLDPSTQNGAIIVHARENNIVLGMGCNNLPKGIAPKPERLVSPEKYKWIEHAERQAIYDAASLGYSTYGSTMYCSWSACTDCARAIIQSGIRILVRHKEAMDRDAGDKWTEEIQKADIMFKESGVIVIDFAGPVMRSKLLYQGKEW